MIVDTSVLVAILRGEAGAENLARTVMAEPASMSTASYVELMCVLARSGDPATSRRADRMLELLGVELVPVTEDQARMAAEAYRAYGRGSGHDASLNYGDTFAYALAVCTDEALLFTGSDFTHTDVRVAGVMDPSD